VQRSCCNCYSAVALAAAAAAVARMILRPTGFSCSSSPKNGGWALVLHLLLQLLLHLCFHHCALVAKEEAEARDDVECGVLHEHPS
jgi:hypothetical protein